jgi:YVTN family beta-propeller protein
MVQLPSGAVTFLFTDIEGSTRLVKQLRDRYPAVLADHQRLLRAAFSAHGGHEIDTQGDSFFVAFANAREALLAAVDGQLALTSHVWPEGADVRVRMGLHTGQAAASEGRYTGLAVHRAARIGAAGHGGQILLSQATQTLLEDEEEDLHVSLRDLGEQRLKDLDRPVRLYQATGDGLPASFPPIRGDTEPAGAPATAGAARHARSRWLVLGAAGALALVAAIGILVLRGGSGGGLDGVHPNHVGLIDPGSNEIVAEIPVGLRPGPIAARGGSVWVGNLQDRNLMKIDAAKRASSATVSLENRTPTGIAVGPGTVWVAHGLRGELSQVDPQFGQVTRTIDVAGTAFGFPHGSVALGAGSAWAVFGDSTLARVSLAGEVVGTTLAGIQPAGIVFAAGSVWVANSGDATVQQFNPETFREGPVKSFNAGTQPQGITYADGAIWVANAGDDFVTRIDPASGANKQITVGAGPTAVASGSGAVWVANTTAGTVSRIDPTTNKVVATINIGNAPAGLVVAAGYVWVTAQAR